MNPTTDVARRLAMRSYTRLIIPIFAFILLAFHPDLRGQPTTTVTTLYTFTNATDGADPEGRLAQDSAGNVYGTTVGTGYGSGDEGTIFRITPTGGLTTLHSFMDTFTGSDPIAPFFGLIQGSDGNFYGTTRTNPYGFGGGSGTIFQITPAGVYTALYTFSGDGEGGGPSAVIQGSDGNLYGTTIDGGSANAGTVFRLTSAGVLTTLHSFTGQGAEGDSPYGGLVQGSDGNFYGTTFTGGGSSQSGTVYRITPAGLLTTLHSFTGTGTDGANPFLAGLVQGSGGNFFGTTRRGGSSGAGTVFRITPAGTYTTLHSFTGSGTDGADPGNNLVQGSDGNFYGTTDDGGSGGTGTVFRITPSGVYTTLHSFGAVSNEEDNAGGAGPSGAVVQGSDGSFYGTTSYGGSSSYGTVFKIGAPLVITSAGKATATVGHAFSYQITATNGPTSFSATGLPAGLSVNAQTGVISGTPQKAGTDTLTLTTSNGLGRDSATLTLIIAAAGTPYITSALTLEVPEDTDFTYQITATNSPTSFGVQGLPAGVMVDRNTGLITGKQHGLGTATWTLNAYNAEGKGSAYLAFRVYGAPVITSAATASGEIGKAFSYQITASNQPTSFGVQGLPAGFSVNTSTGLLTGTPKGAGKVSLTLNAYNSIGKGSATLTLTITAQ